MAHDLITLVLSGRSKITARFYVPSLTGTFTANQIRVTYEGEKGEPWSVSNLSGTVIFEGERVSINLTQTDSIRKAQPLEFNGTYSLVNPSAVCLTTQSTATLCKRLQRLLVRVIADVSLQETTITREQEIQRGSTEATAIPQCLGPLP
jgi:hypothetical protein